MFLGLLHIAAFGPYAVLLATVCAGLVLKIGIFEGLLITLIIDAIINDFIFQKLKTCQLERLLMNTSINSKKRTKNSTNF